MRVIHWSGVFVSQRAAKPFSSRLLNFPRSTRLSSQNATHPPPYPIATVRHLHSIAQPRRIWINVSHTWTRQDDITITTEITMDSGVYPTRHLNIKLTPLVFKLQATRLLVPQRARANSKDKNNLGIIGHFGRGLHRSPRNGDFVLTLSLLSVFYRLYPITFMDNFKYKQPSLARKIYAYSTKFICFEMPVNFFTQKPFSLACISNSIVR